MGWRCEKVRITLSGGTTGMSRCIKSERGLKMWSDRDKAGLVMRLYALRAKMYVVEGCSVSAWRSAGTSAQVVGEGATMLV